ncbi:DUF2975 domain-containing protein [Arcobacter sp.]|uniref:DUF2975 domain-containing protein n=1 Tax=Arcobacter sp. TaxID=1872629 RepID=UPI003D0DF095
MDNMSKIKKVSKLFNLLLTGLLIILPIYYILYWLFINSLSESLINVNIGPVPECSNALSVNLQIIGFISSLLPLSALIYGIIHIKKLFLFYQEGITFSLEQVILFKKVSKALALWIVFSIIYESIKSILFSWDNPVGERILEIGFNGNQIGIVIISIVILVIAWIMDEGRILSEENKLIV